MSVYAGEKNKPKEMILPAQNTVTLISHDNAKHNFKKK